MANSQQTINSPQIEGFILSNLGETMPQNIAALETARLLMLSSAGTAASVVGGLSVGLKQQHMFLNLPFPYWFFLVSTLCLTLIGAFLSLKNDYMRSQHTPFGNFFLAMIMGLVISFVVLPVVVEKPSVGILQIAGFFGGLFGTIALRIIIDLVSDTELRDEVQATLKKLAVKWLRRVGKLLGGGE